MVEVIRGDITKQSNVEAVVNAANGQLLPGGGVAGAIHRAAGPALNAACRPLAPIAPGEAVITRAFEMPNKFIIHCLGPVYGQDVPSDKILASCYKNALQICKKQKIRSIAFPAISTGIFGYPVAEAADVACNAIAEFLNETSGKNEEPQVIRFVLFSDQDFRVHKEAVDRYFGISP